MPYKFSDKELDEETGLYYCGARCMNPVTSPWYGWICWQRSMYPRKGRLECCLF
ncbi:hypothetical protein HMPREF0670_02864 [Prevotella sp. oral taxon 317 str. F0108]|nr:hypothetical protein HMPREF0670_02864 [Prevotella sp. oral taxon 317 str. F0108]